MRKSNLYSLGASIIIHAVILSLLLLSFTFHSSFKIPGKTHPVIAYLAPYTLQKIAKPHNTQPIIKSHAGILPIPKQPQKTISKPHHQAIPKNKKISGNKLNHLITLIYQAIDKHKIYPQSAQDLQHSGKVIITFNLNPTGSINGLQLAHSSGYHDLDQAALNTIKATQPIIGVNKYLKVQQTFSIPIVYES